MKARLATCALCAIASFSCSFAAVAWTGPSVFTSGPIVFDDSLAAPGVGVFITSPSPVVPVDQANGFRVTQAQFTYLVAPAEVGHVMELRWTVNRPLNEPAAIAWQNTGILDGDLFLSPVYSALTMTMLTTTTMTDAAYSKIVVPGAFFTPGIDTPFNFTNSGAPAFQPAGADIFLQQFSLQFVAGAPNAPLILNLPNSAESIAPEPSSLAAIAAGVLGVVGLARRRRTA